MKKIVSVLLALLMLLSLGACKVETGISSAEDTNSTVSVNPADYDLNLAGLANCLQAAGYIAGDPTEMEASFIGAALGRRYAFEYNKSAVVVEMYEYDEAAVADSEVLKSVDETGSFTILGTNVSAIHAGRYLFIYNDASEKEENIARRDAVIAMFEEFAAL
ncbi:MAG: hypothetical protein IKU17_01000 [Clostridia bacterium]|nr:hypothetical protein [Clostridia bacterium]